MATLCLTCSISQYNSQVFTSTESYADCFSLKPWHILIFHLSFPRERLSLRPLICAVVPLRSTTINWNKNVWIANVTESLRMFQASGSIFWLPRGHCTNTTLLSLAFVYVRREKLICLSYTWSRFLILAAEHILNGCSHYKLLITPVLYEILKYVFSILSLAFLHNFLSHYCQSYLSSMNTPIIYVSNLLICSGHYFFS